jgi:hypothetical protein
MNRIKNLLEKVKLGRKQLYLAPVLLVLFLALAGTARAGVSDILSLFQTITDTLQNGIGGVLKQIKVINGTINNLHQQVIWPMSAINQAKGFVNATTNQYRGILNQIQTLPVASATLVNPAQLEARFRSGNAGNLAQLQAAFTQVYNQVPGATQAQSLERNLMDMDDASAMGSLKTSMIADQASGRMLSLADTLETQTAASAPGSAPMLATQAQITSLENQAYLSKLLASELRVEATKLAHENTTLKNSAANAQTLRQQMQQVLTHP